MAWTNLPVTTGTTDTNSFDFIDQFNKAVVERAWGAGSCVWPYSSNQWESGTVLTATETTITTGKTWCGGTDDTSGNTYTQPFDCITFPFYEAPTSWVLVIDDNDRTKVVQTGSISWTNTGTITFPNIRDFVTSGHIPSVASLVGKNWYIIRGDYPLWWHNRIMEWPNVTEYAKGTIEDLTAGFDAMHVAVAASPTFTGFRDSQQRWVPNEHVGRDLLVYSNESPSFLKRVAITANTADTITYSTKTWKPAIGTNWCIVASGGRAYPGKAPVYPYWWYRGIMDSFASHHPTDVIGSASMPAGTIQTPGQGPGGECDRPLDVAWDSDVWTEPTIAPDDQLCGRPADKPYAPDLFKTIRGLQLAIESLSPDYVEAKSYDGASSVPNLNPAEMFRLAGINSFTGTSGAVAGSSGNDGSSNNQIAVSGVTLPYHPIQVWYSFKDTEAAPTGGMGTEGGHIGDYYKWGRGYMLDNSTLVDESFDLVFRQDYDDGTNPIVRGDNGRPVTISAGWTRYVPREFKRMFNSSVFIPDMVADIDTGELNPVDPAAPVKFDDESQDCYGVGAYRTRGKSDHYIERKHENQSYKEPQGFGWEAGDTFQTGDIARYIGDNFSDPSIGGTATDGTSQFYKDAVHSDARYVDHYFTGIIDPKSQGDRDNQYGGISTEDGSTTWLKDKNQNWFDHQWFGGTMRTESGTATGGSTTSITDNTKDDSNESSPTNPLHCYWLLSRFPDASGPYVGFTVEVDYVDTSVMPHVTTTYQRLITAGSHTTVGVSWAEALPHTASGCVYRIKEPYSVNRFKARVLHVTRINPTTHLKETATTTITANSADTLFFSALPWTATKDCVYTIEEPIVGTVWKWNGSAWVPPTGADAVRHGVTSPNNFHLNQVENLPTYKKRCGRFIIGDAVCSEVWNELYAALNVLKHVKWQVTWNEDAVDGTPENNGETEGGYDSGTMDTSGSPPDCHDLGNGAKDHAEGLWGTNAVPSGGGPPKAESAGTFTKFGTPPCPDDGCHQYSIDRLYAYGTVDGICPREACAVDYYDYATGPYGQDTTAGCVAGHDVHFNSNGDAVAYHAFTLFGSSGAAVRTTARTKLGGSGMPAGAYPNGTTCHTRNEGYLVVDATAVVKWNVSGGFNFCT